jgi:hypothetical protein
MKFLDFMDLLDGEPAKTAVLSTFQLDAEFFERRLLRCSALAKARRILIFMDAGQWLTMLREDVPARFLNRRYLVVPVRPAQGVFHPKLNLLVTEQGGQVQCGSNNLTRSGCSSNLEMLNSFRVDLEGYTDEAVRLAQEALSFFKRACDDAEEQTGRIAREWLEEMPKAAPWLGVTLPAKQNRTVRLIHTYEGSLWERMTNMLSDHPPKRLLVISPFYDGDAELVKRVYQRWPKCEVELVVQQQYTTLPVSSLRNLHAKLHLSEIQPQEENASRHLHAKLVAWEAESGTSCLVGSANFTSAAFDARNVETCLFVSDAKELIQRLFDKELGKKTIALDDFDPGTGKEPEPADGDVSSLRVRSAILTLNGELRVAYQHRLNPKPSALRLSIRTPGEKRHRALLSLPNREQGSATLVPPETALADAHGTILAILVADLENGPQESPPMWVVQEARLTYEPGEGSSSTKSKVEESGEGLLEFLDGLAKRDGIVAVIEYLRHLRIRFHDGSGGLPGSKKFRLRIRDPFHPDVAPEWLMKAKADLPNWEAAISDFADRHEKQRLRRHAKRGNINGMENFLDIFTTLVHLLYVNYARGLYQRNKLIGRFCQYLDVATAGIDTSGDYSDGYLNTLYDNLGDADYLQEICDELNFLGHIRAAFVILQRVRFIPNESTPWGSPPKRPSDCLPMLKETLKKTIADVGLKEPSMVQIKKALEEYKMFTASDLIELEHEIVL